MFVMIEAGQAPRAEISCLRPSAQHGRGGAGRYESSLNRETSRRAVPMKWAVLWEADVRRMCVGGWSVRLKTEQFRDENSQPSSRS